MNLSMNNLCVKTHNNFLPETQPSRTFLSARSHITENNNDSDKTVQEVWSKYNFQINNDKVEAKTQLAKMSWATADHCLDPVEEAAVDVQEEEDVKVEEEETVLKRPEKEPESPSHHARRPMNAFLIFCKKHRPIVRERYPNLENRGVTRILGEWWALLDESDKAPYTNLAKEYKDAFLSANPDFKWYKLPAPPLRTLSVRPSSLIKVPSPVSSPAEILSFNHGSEFTPGKLADESQLGSLTSLMNDNFANTTKLQKSNENNNNIDETDQIYDSSLESPTNLIKTTLPPKPFKKRNFEKYPDNNRNVARIILNDEQNHDESTMTNQDLMDKVVDKIYTKDDCDGLKTGEIVRKSERQCKGKIYQKFMVEGKLLGNKRDGKMASHSEKMDISEFNSKFETETPNLDHTIKRLAERTNMQKLLEVEEKCAESKPNTNERIRRLSENNNEHNTNSNSTQNNFNLDLRISNLPSLSYDVFYQRKKESKKRKNRIRTDDSKNKVPKLMKSEHQQQQVVGSKKRKNKQTITHLEKKEDNNIGSDLLALATLAEVAANTQKINSSEATKLK